MSLDEALSGVIYTSISSDYKEPSDTVISLDEASSEVTYTSISSDYEEPSNIRSLGVVVYGYDRLLMHPVDPPSPDYVSGLKELEHALLSPDYVSGPEHPEYLAPSDEKVPAEEQPLHAVVSPTTDSPGYVTEDDEEEEEESYGDDADEEEEDEDEEEEEEHLASADSVPPPAYRTTARMSIQAQTPIPFPSKAEVDMLLAIPTPPSSPLTPLSSLLPRIPSPPFPVPSPPTASPIYTKAPLGYMAAGIRLRTASPPPLPLSLPLPLQPPIILPCTRASMVMMRVVAPSTYYLAPLSGTPPLLPIPLPSSSPPLLLPSINCRANFLEVVLPPQKWLCIAPGLRYEIEESSSTPTARPTGGFRADYGFIGTLDVEIRRDPDIEIGYRITDVWEDADEIAKEIPTTDVAELGQRMIDFVKTSEARAYHEAWVQSMDASDTGRSKVKTLHTTILAQETEIRDLRAANRRRQAQLAEALTLLRTLQTQMKMPQRKTPKTRTTFATATTSMTDAAIRALISQGVADALAEHEIQRNNNLNGDESQGSGSGTEGVVGLTQWFERIETVFNISNYAVENQVNEPWNTLMKMMTAKYCPRNEIKKLEMEIWELKVKESDMIHGSVMAFKPKIMQDAVEFVTELIDKKIRTLLNIRLRIKGSKMLTNSNKTRGRTLARTTLLGLGRRSHMGDLSHYALNETITMMVCQKVTCFECGAQGHFKKECLKLKNNNRDNQGGNGNAPAKVYVVGNGGTNPDSNVITELGSIDVIIVMDWLARYHVVIVCTEKIIRIP
nr:hypothetical protein [Tanacetum cinerariifolium]